MVQHVIEALAGRVRRALPSPSIASGAAVIALGLAAQATLGALGPPTLALAADQVRDHRDAEPAARLEVVVESFYIFDDRDWGEGDLVFTVSVCEAATCATNLVESAPIEFGADTGDTIVVNRTVPAHGDKVANAPAVPGLGFPLYAGREYLLVIKGIDEDPTVDDVLGHARLPLDGDGQWQVGHHSLRGTNNWTGVLGYAVEIEVRRAPLPDLRASNIRVRDLPGSAKKLVCVGVQNVEIADAGPFEVAFTIDGSVPPGGRTAAGHLKSGDGGELCAEFALPTTGQHSIAAHVDASHTVVEFDETNNVYEQTYLASDDGAAPSATPTTAPAAALPDLIVTAIKVNGRAPNGKDDCKDGRNTIAVLVKNAGQKDAGDFAVRLVVDEARGDALERHLDRGLGAGKEVAVTFDGVRLKKGAHSLAATADWTTGTGVAESDEGNNERIVTARCEDDD